MKPSFKRKFSVPSQSVKPTRDDQNEASPVNKNTENDLNKEVTEEPEITCKFEYSPVENVETHTQNTNEPKQALSDSQYDEIFDAVLTKATSDNLNSEKSKSEKAADQFVERMQNSTPTNIQEQNEITPSTSPQEDTRSPPKLLLKKCSKDKSEKSALDSIKAPHKRTSLGYSKPDKERHSLGNLKTKKKEKHRRHQTCDESSRKNSEKVFNKGVWVQCGERDCLKWRFLPDCSDPSSLPGFWRCSLNADDDQNKCSAPEVDWTSCLSSSQDHFVYTEYNAGSIVWAKMAGYPPWPAMVDSDPDTDMLYEYDEEGAVLRYHVVFLDKNVSRAWIPSRCIEPYNHSNNQLNLCNEKHFKSELNTAITAADEALTMSLAKRIEKFSFGQRFKGDEESIWTSLTKTRKSKKRKNKFLMEQVVPVSTSPSAESKNSNDYWETATDDMLPLSKKEENHGKKKKREKVEKEKKETKKLKKLKQISKIIQLGNPLKTPKLTHVLGPLI
uniref:zinc finger CW-type PWWP domain protein 1-like isoform X2 n=1 Tax=Ciona intestinalis TaxID=7719 RepID=UPI000EF542E9|nr:zinc finger CW-type PWWP domain protein 1-like isoform X2 [Ciona intestinalis]|eukprot:XP_026694135.1 zinc finger CW-type PWWP domain protein 1-like isoform X2 [Ciona intestinalis]